MEAQTVAGIDICLGKLSRMPGAAVRTVTTVLTRRQARKRTSHELLPGMTIPEVSRVTPVVLETVKETRKVESTPKGAW